MVITGELTRLGRHVSGIQKAVKALLGVNIDLYSVNENFDITTSSGIIVLQLLGTINEFERNQIPENVFISIVSLVRNQKRYSGRRRLGCVAGAYCAIANYLNKQGYQTVKGNTFSTSAVKDILNNKVYGGYLEFARYINWDTKRRKGKNPNPILVKGEHVPIIDQDTYEVVQVRLAMETMNPTRNFTGENVLTGLIRCPECGAPMAASNVTNTLKDGTKKRIRYYSRSQFRNKGASVCSANSIRAGFGENFMACRLKEIVQVPDLLQGIVNELNETLHIQVKPLEQELAVLETNRLAVEEKLEKWRQLVQLEPELKDSLVDRMAELHEDLTVARRREYEIMSILQNQHQKIEVNDVQQILSGIDTMLFAQPKSVIKAIYRSFIKEIHFDKLNKEHITITMNFSEKIVQQINDLYKETVSSTTGDKVSLRYKGFSEVAI